MNDWFILSAFGLMILYNIVKAAMFRSEIEALRRRIYRIEERLK